MIKKIKKALIFTTLIYIAGFITLLVSNALENRKWWELVFYPVGLGLLELILEPIFMKIYNTKLFIWIDSLNPITKILLIFFIFTSITILIFILVV